MCFICLKIIIIIISTIFTFNLLRHIVSYIISLTTMLWAILSVLPATLRTRFNPIFMDFTFYFHSNFWYNPANVKVTVSDITTR